MVVAAFRAVDEPALLHDVAEPVHHPGVGGRTVAAGAAGLLVIALDALRQVEVRHEAHVGLVDAHAEGDGRDHHDAVLALEACLPLGAGRGVEARVVGEGRDALGLQPLGRLVHALARQAVDDARLTGVRLADEGEQLRARVALVGDGVADVRAVEARHEHARTRRARAAR